MNTTALSLALGGLLTFTCGAELREKGCSQRKNQTAPCCPSEETRPPREKFLAFSATWCGPCQKMAPVLDNLEKQGFAIHHVDVDQNQQLAKKFHVTALPTVIRVVDGVETGRIVGLASQHNLCQLTESASPQACCSTCAADDCCRCEAVPAATDVQSLLRATYALPEERARTLVELLKQNGGLPLDAHIESDALTITTTPAAQRTIGNFVKSFLSNGAE